MTQREKILAAALAASLAGAAGAAMAVGTYDKPVNFNVTFSTESENGRPERDVFIEREARMAQVYRPAHDERDLRKPLFAPIMPLGYASHESTATGPWPKSRPLGLTLGAWLSAEGRATYSCAEGKARLIATFTKLVPEGVYSLRHSFAPRSHGGPAGGGFDLPIGARDGAQATFRANADGSAMVVRDFAPCLQLTGAQIVSGLAVTWHSDGKTQSVRAGDYGTRAHRQLTVELPRRSDL